MTNSYTASGQKNPQITAQVGSFTDRVSSVFELRPSEIDVMNTVSEETNAVTELVVKNNLNQTQYFSWIFDTGFQNRSSSQPLNITMNNIFAYIASNYSTSGAYKTKATINRSSFGDNETGVIVS